MGIQVNDANFKDEVLNSSQPVLVDFWAPWCGPCKMIAPIIDEIASEYEGKLKVCKLNVDEAPQTAGNYQVMSIPTLALFKNGELIEKLVGAVPKQQILTMIEKYL